MIADSLLVLSTPEINDGLNKNKQTFKHFSSENFEYIIMTIHDIKNTKSRVLEKVIKKLLQRLIFFSRFDTKKL